MQGAGYFLTPSGLGDIRLIEVEAGSNHIGTVLAYPEKFGLTEEYLREVYKKHNEDYGIEGEAREEILTSLAFAGWVRVREYQNYWSLLFSKNREFSNYNTCIIAFANMIADSKSRVGNNRGNKGLYAELRLNEVIKINETQTSLKNTIVVTVGDLLSFGSIDGVEREKRKSSYYVSASKSVGMKINSIDEYIPYLEIMTIDKYIRGERKLVSIYEFIKG